MVGSTELGINVENVGVRLVGAKVASVGVKLTGCKVGLGTIAAALAALSMAVLGHFFI